MPELPEVETTSTMLRHYLLNDTITNVKVHAPKLRWPIPDLTPIVSKKVLQVKRRGKYILVDFAAITLIIHLGMTGSIWHIKDDSKRKKHDHVEITTANGHTLRYNDPRRFGCILLSSDALSHKLIKPLGAEPLTCAFSGKYLFDLAKKSQRAIKNFIMDSHIVVGVGNIYAAESLFLAGIHPLTPAKEVTYNQFVKLHQAIVAVLNRAIELGGTTLKDYYSVDGKPGYFVNELNVYGRKDLPCPKCKTAIQQIIIGQRSSAFCPQCQPR